MPTPWDFQAMKCDGSMSVDRGQGNLGKGGEPHGEASVYAPEALQVPLNSYPNLTGYGYDPENPQFSSKMSGEPLDLLESTRPGIEAHADLNQIYGLNQPVATLGSHPFLRDDLANPSENSGRTINLRQDNYFHGVEVG